MAEGLAHLNQQVVNAGLWAQAERLVSRDDGRAATDDRDIFGPDCDPGDIRRAVEGDLIPRILLGHDRFGEPRSIRPAIANFFDRAAILRFTDIVLMPGGDRAAAAYLDDFRARGVRIEDIYLQLFQPVARHIGELWVADLCNFVEVTLALGTMQRLMRSFGPAFHRDGRTADAARQALLVPAHGDQHTFGLWMVAEFFRRAGWNVWVESFASTEALCAAVRDTWFTVIGFSESCDGRLDELASDIRRVRHHSRNREVGVIVGGSFFVDHPEDAGRVGADAAGIDAQMALTEAESFAARGIRPC